ncbi:hypothetical protein, unlikely [Trypanosoma brucei gambiense DAL972]|uniref:Uncharacterized protein n=1 Tax=Trypanosoma brucei gambiense (strain MHOM/CI/86/DAL972) TaxID=679716 RepID=C9ZTC7_TRYB9|nr:hypothetical protein, unlikely [Trypanosoma brucei gambiense DAL972]CBH12662.1 hypothetical protein, unlikely [Trypanosoma brucei gambiense DAL972]|eukprot:XP_011774942.1 hypothetical protein, unlikely [Trypanosoma brucei gambiense DAL972]
MLNLKSLAEQQTKEKIVDLKKGEQNLTSPMSQSHRSQPPGKYTVFFEMRIENSCAASAPAVSSKRTTMATSNLVCSKISGRSAWTTQQLGNTLYQTRSGYNIAPKAATACAFFF